MRHNRLFNYWILSYPHEISCVLTYIHVNLHRTNRTGEFWIFMKIEVIENDRLFSSFFKFILEFLTILLVEQLFLHANACDRNMLLVTTNIWTIIPHKNWLRRPASGSTANDHSTDPLSNFTLKNAIYLKIYCVQSSTPCSLSWFQFSNQIVNKK